jgi:hypothetical protein
VTPVSVVLRWCAILTLKQPAKLKAANRAFFRAAPPTIVRLASGEELTIFDVAWGRDMGDMWEHVTANCSPPVQGREVHFFHLSEVESLWDPETRTMLMEQTPAPGET